MKSLKILLRKNLLNEQDNNRELELLKKKGPMMDWFYENVVMKVKEIPDPKYKGWISYVDKNTGEEYMVYYKKDGYFRVDYYRIWSYFETHYSHNNMEIQNLIKDLMAEYYGLGDIIPRWT